MNTRTVTKTMRNPKAPERTFPRTTALAQVVTKTMKNPKALAPFLAIRTEQEYDGAVERLNALVDEIGDNPKDPRYRLIETLSVLIEAYDREHHSLPEASGVEVIRFLMEEHGLTQKDLPEIGSQGVVSEVLAGHRTLNVRQLQALAKRFSVAPGVFLGTTRVAYSQRSERFSAD